MVRADSAQPSQRSRKRPACLVEDDPRVGSQASWPLAATGSPIKRLEDMQEIERLLHNAGGRLSCLIAVERPEG